MVIALSVAIDPLWAWGKDTFIYRSRGGNDNFGAQNQLQIGPDRTTYERRALLAFDLSAIPANAQITAATLQLYLFATWGSDDNFTLEAHKMLRDWAEGNGSGWDNNSATGCDWVYADEPNNIKWNADGMQPGTDYSSTILGTALIDLSDDEVWKSWDVLEYEYRDLMTAYGVSTYGRYKVQNKYDAAGRRVRRNDDSGSTFYIHSGPQVLAEYSTNRYPDAEYLYAGGRRIAKLKTQNDAPRAPVGLKAVSGGADDGWFVDLFVDGVDYALNQRGYNLVVVDESSGTVVDQARFDTYGSTAEAEAMATYINALPPGRIVLVGIRDEASRNMTENAYLALESLGSLEARNVGYRDSHALIGRKGAIPGTVQEMHTARYSGPATAEVHKVDCRIQSAGWDDGNFVKLFVNGASVGTNNRGHNLVVVDETTGDVLNAVSYDTYASSTAADDLANFINSLPDGCIVLKGIGDEGSVSMRRIGDADNGIYQLAVIMSVIQENRGHIL
jgi:hypothetical protein